MENFKRQTGNVGVTQHEQGTESAEWSFDSATVEPVCTENNENDGLFIHINILKNFKHKYFLCEPSGLWYEDRHLINSVNHEYNTMLNLRSQ